MWIQYDFISITSTAQPRTHLDSGGEEGFKRLSILYACKYLVYMEVTYIYFYYTFQTQLFSDTVLICKRGIWPENPLCSYVDEMNGRLKSNNFLREKHTASRELLLDLKTFILLPREKKKGENLWENKKI